ncbi:MAG TPA: flagellar hook capping FlgD N-terminal domain-containing protein [Ilumatobacter sp.]|nr:flagellar hook capping FlgD N-terminal domain-containing protein [Ilumatobacter sp.]
MTTPVSSTTAAGSAGTQYVDHGNPGANLDRNAFLKLLVAQLKYQDPTNPADTSQIVTQSAQLTMVDRLNEMATSFQTANSLSRLALATSMVGQNVSFLDPGGEFVWARVDGVSIDGADVILAAGGYSVPLGAIGAVLAPTPEAPSPPPSGGGTTTPPAGDPDPVDPTDPVDTTDPVDPGDTTDPDEPVDPGDPVDPDEPTP